MTQSTSYDNQHASNWSSSMGFILACVGSAVGLGNLWKFPFIAYENGGGAFVLAYLACILILGVPLLMAEMILGRHGRLGPYGTFKKITCDSVLGKGVGGLCILIPALILSFYSVVAGWTLEYFYHSFSGGLADLSLETVGPRFGGFVSDPVKQIFYHTIFMGITTGLLIKGTGGIEKAVKFLMPLLAVLVCLVMFLSISNNTEGAMEALRFLFAADFSKLTGHGLLEGLGHAFFTLSLGMGAIIIYGSYLPKSVSIVKSSFLICFFRYTHRPHGLYDDVPHHLWGQSGVE